MEQHKNTLSYVSHHLPQTLKYPKGYGSGSAALDQSSAEADHRWGRYWSEPGQSFGSGPEWQLSWSFHQLSQTHCGMANSPAPSTTLPTPPNAISRRGRDRFSCSHALQHIYLTRIIFIVLPSQDIRPTRLLSQCQGQLSCLLQMSRSDVRLGRAFL